MRVCVYLITIYCSLSLVGVSEKKYSPCLIVSSRTLTKTNSLEHHGSQCYGDAQSLSIGFYKGSSLFESVLPPWFAITYINVWLC